MISQSFPEAKKSVTKSDQITYDKSCIFAPKITWKD
jgi:hypothetical protein